MSTKLPLKQMPFIDNPDEVMAESKEEKQESHLKTYDILRTKIGKKEQVELFMTPRGEK